MTPEYLRARLPEVALAAVLLAVSVVTIEVRMDDPWADGTLLLLALVPAVAVLALAAAVARDPAATTLPSAGSIIVIAGLVLAAYSVGRLGTLITEDYFDKGALRTLVLALFGGIAAAVRARTGSGVALFVAGVTAISVIVSVFAWLGHDGSADLYRAALLTGFVAAFAAGVAAGPQRGGLLVAAAGIALLGFAFVAGAISSESVGWGWKAALGAGGVAMALYSAQTKARGPGYQAFFALLLFAVAAGNADPVRLFSFGEESPPPAHKLSGWPIALIVLTVLAAAAAVRPRPAAPAE